MTAFLFEAGKWVSPDGRHYQEGLDDIRDLSWLRYVAERRPVK